MKRKSKSIEKFPHFRKYFKSGHPTLIVGEQKAENNREEWRYRKVMHAERDGRHFNEVVTPNPNKNDPRPMHIARRVRHDDKENFSKWKYPWQYPKKDNKKK